ncbi:MAG: glycoside hydrolase N-terminal domain-containing protein [Clostridia bacterium]|nr:glycoside hydrolase N-terminal domain-containing protein [Clostridia bacterium]
MKSLKKYDLFSAQSITNWDEAIPLGNGKLGSLVYGDGGPLKLSVDRVDLWDERPHPCTANDNFTFKALTETVKKSNEENWQENSLPFRMRPKKAYPTKLTAGRIELNFVVKTQELISRLSLRNAVASVEIERGKAGKAELFLSATKFIGVARVWGEYTLDLHIPNYFSDQELDGAGDCLQYPSAKIVKEKDFTYYIQSTLEDFSFGIVVLRKEREEYSELYYTIATNKDDGDFIDAAKKELESAAALGYEFLKQEHIAWWRRYWSKSEISIGEELLEKTYYRSYYLFASCSRKGFYPMPLQGVWTADDDCPPPWRGDYHHDTNTQLSYQSFLKANRLEEGSCFIEYLWNLRDRFKRYAKEFYGVDGLLLPATSTLGGNPISGWTQYSCSPTMTIWAAQSFDEYWLYTGDEKFLRTRAYPFFKEVGEAVFGLLEEKEGKLYLPLSSSPEIFDDTLRAYLKPNSNFDLSLLIYLYKTLKNYSEILGKAGGRYAIILEKLDDIAVDGEGVVLLDKTQRLPESHRHFSHLMCMYPLHLLNYDTAAHKRIYENTLLHIEQLGTGWWVGFSFAMCAQLYAMAHNGNAAYEKLRAFAKGFVADNGFHLNGDFKNYGFSQWHYRPFTLESSFGFCDALQEMLLQEHNGYIEVFPAIAEEWKEKASFRRLRSYNGVLVSAELAQGAVRKIVLESRKTTNVKILNNFDSDILYAIEKGKTSAIKAKKGEIFEITLPKGRVEILKQ